MCMYIYTFRTGRFIVFYFFSLSPLIIYFIKNSNGLRHRPEMRYSHLLGGGCCCCCCCDVSARHTTTIIIIISYLYKGLMTSLIDRIYLKRTSTGNVNRLMILYFLTLYIRRYRVSSTTNTLQNDESLVD